MQQIKYFITAKKDFQITELIHGKSSKLFQARRALIILLEDTPNELCSWAEACACHEHLVKGQATRRRHQLLRADFGHEVPGGFPVAGCRGCEVAAHGMEHYFDIIANLRFAQYAERWEKGAGALAPHEWMEVLSCFETGKNFLRLALGIKFDFWRRIPWKILGGSHWDPEIARRVLRECLVIYDVTPADQVHLLHHRMSIKFLDPRLVLL